MRYFSYGGGVQSTAALVLASQGKLEVNAFLFANVGEDSEHPDTLRYVHEVAIPFAQAHSIPFHELFKTRKDGSKDTVLSWITRPGSRSIGIPVRMANGAPGQRACTFDFKIRVTAKHAWKDGARKQNPATMLLGISIDEYQRMRNDSGISYIKLAYPLIDLRLSRQDCIRIIERAGLPVPPKSSCWFCPFHTLATWQKMRHQQPVLFARAVRLERLINDRRALLGKDHVWLSSALKPLDHATSEEEQLSLFASEEEYSCGAFTCAVAEVRA